MMKMVAVRKPGMYPSRSKAHVFGSVPEFLAIFSVQTTVNRREINMGHITLACGTAFSGRAAYMDQLWHTHLDEALLLLPTAHLARKRENNFVRRYSLPGLWGVRAWAPAAFTRTLLEHSGLQIVMISALERHLMVRRALEGIPEAIVREAFASTSSDKRNVVRNMGPDSPLPHTRPPGTAAGPPISSEAASIEITPGLVRHLLHVINALKQAAATPEQFRSAVDKRRTPGAFDALVATVYDNYQKMLIERGLYDVPGLYWEAEQRCLAGEAALPARATVLLLDGFDDFTPSEQRFLVALSRHASKMVIGLNHDPDPDRADLFQLQQQCIESFQRQTNIQTLSFQTDVPGTQSQYAAKHLFWRNPPPPAEGLRCNVRIMACADRQHEIEAIGRRIKRQLALEGVSPGTIAVALTDIRQCGSTVHDIFNSFGIPHILRTGAPLSYTTTGAFVMRLLDAVRDWDARTVTALLSAPHIHTPPDDAAAVMAFPVIARHAGVVSGRAAWQPALERLEKRLAREDTLPERERLPVPRAAEALALFGHRLDMLQSATDAFEACNTLRDHALWLDRQLSEFGLESAVSALGAPAGEHEAEALYALRALLEVLAATDYSNETMAGVLFVQLLRDGMQERCIPLSNTDGAGVICTGVDGLRHEKFAHVYLGGLNEGMLPCPAGINAVYSESDIHRLRNLGLDYRGRNEHTFRERLCFHHALCAAVDTVTLSWRKLDASGREALPSPFVVDVEELFSGNTLPGHTTCGHATSIVEPDPGPDCFIAETGAASSPRDLASAVYYHGHDGLATHFPEILAPVKVFAAVEAQRNSTEPFGIYDGIIHAPDLLDWLAGRYGEDAQFSISQLERYIAFPYQFFIEQLLRLRETRQPDDELDPMVRGTVMHDALQAFHEHYRGNSAADILSEHGEAARSHLRACVAEAFSRHAWRMTSTPEPMLCIEQDRLEMALNRYLYHTCDRFDDNMKPNYFELAFGYAPRQARDAASRAAPFVMTIDGTDYRFSGKIDRIDTSDVQARIIDYKSSSKPTRKEITQGLDLQLTVYAWAVEQYLMPDKRCVEAWYLPIYKWAPVEALNKDAADRLYNAQQSIVNAIRGIRSGQFPPLPHDALSDYRRSFHPAARYEAWRIQRKCPDRAFDDEFDREEAS